MADNNFLIKDIMTSLLNINSIISLLISKVLHFSKKTVPLTIAEIPIPTFTFSILFNHERRY